LLVLSVSESVKGTRMEKLTQPARLVLLRAHQAAEYENAEEINLGHLFWGLAQDEGVIGRVLRDHGFVADPLQGKPQVLAHPEISTELEEILEAATREVHGTEKLIDSVHLLRAALKLENIDVFLQQYGANSAQLSYILEGALQDYLFLPKLPVLADIPSQPPQPETPIQLSAATMQLVVDLTELAEKGLIDPIIGRAVETKRLIQILARRMKNNPVLIGEAGVGKTAIVEGLVQRIVAGKVPATLRGKRVLRVDVGSLIAGAGMRGQFEERLKRLIEDVKQAKAIIFIDEIHLLVGAGGEGLDAANILKPALSRGEVQVIGATTMDEYRRRIEKDAALERRFQPIIVKEPSIDETIEILRGIAPAYEKHHRLKYTDDALVSAAKLAAQYISGRFLPDKAIDLIDEAASYVRNEQSADGQVVHHCNHNGVLKRCDCEQKQYQLEVNVNDIAQVVSMWTGVPVMQLAQEESERLLHMEEHLGTFIIGQPEAIKMLAQAIRRSRVGLKDPRRPIGSFIFLGPTGVGKTELTKVLARFMFGSEKMLIQLDMSEFTERHTSARLVGAPPGYIGYDDAGQLTEAVRRHPYSIIVFDEIEKAHPEVHNMLLQIMEEGHLSDARGRMVDFKNCIIIMTSNIGADVIKRQVSIGFSLKQDDAHEEKLAHDEMERKLLEQLKKVFQPEFINRVDATVVFRALNKSDIKEIVWLELNKVLQRLEEHGITLKITPKAFEKLAELGFNPEMGARPVRRVIQKEIEDRLSEALLGELKDSKDVMVDVEDEQIVVKQNGKLYVPQIEYVYHKKEN